MVVKEDVVAVSVEVSAVVPLIDTEVGDRPQVVGLDALDGSLVTVQVRLTVPVNELPGVTVMVAVLPLVAPGATVMLPLFESVKLVLLLPLGACQKSPQPERKTARSGTAIIKLRVHPQSFIATPGLAPSDQRAGAGSESQKPISEPNLKGTASARIPPAQEGDTAGAYAPCAETRARAVSLAAG